VNAHVSAEKQTALSWIARHEAKMTGLADRIWGYSEPALREYRSAAAHCEFLHECGFEIEQGAGGMPTAFVATHGSGKPVISTYAEYDATPGQSQEPVPYRKPRVPYGPGFTDAHHMLGAAASAAAAATVATMREHSLRGTVKVFGTPAEKLCVGKPYLAKDGYFDGIDAFCTWHPGHTTNNYNAARLEITPGSSYHVLYTFTCDRPWEWSGPGGLAGVRHPGALEGVQVMYTLAKFLRDHMLPRVGGWTISEFIMTGGQATADNWPVDIAQIYYALRSPELDTQDTILRILDNCAASAAKATYTTVTSRIITKTRPGLPNVTMGRMMQRNLELVGPPRFSEDEKAFARELMRGIGLAPLDSPFNETLTPPDEMERETRQHMTPLQTHRGSDDSSDLTWHAPMGRLMVCGNALQPTPGVTYPIWFEAALCGTSAVHKMGLVAAKTIALSMVELLTTPSVLEQAWAEYHERTRGGVVRPLLSLDLQPPIDYRFPEWIDNRYPEEPPANLRWHVPSASL
jgi:aminobenzoyl-glutamate utilization protein B